MKHNLYFTLLGVKRQKLTSVVLYPLQGLRYEVSILKILRKVAKTKLPYFHKLFSRKLKLIESLGEETIGMFFISIRNINRFWKITEESIQGRKTFKRGSNLREIG